MTTEMMLTYQTRFESNQELDSILEQYANLLSCVERSLYAKVAKGQTAAAYKKEFLKKLRSQMSKRNIHLS